MKILNLTVNSKFYSCYVYLILGDWIGKYGGSGAIIFCNKENHNADLPVPYKPDEAQKLFKQGLIKEISISSAGGQRLMDGYSMRIRETIKRLHG